MNRIPLVFFAAVAALVPLSGCQTPPHRPPAAVNTGKNLLFNPECTTDSSADVARADWPATTAFDHQREEFSYRETIIDRQGRFGANQDYAYRRFDSTRTGRTRR